MGNKELIQAIDFRVVFLCLYWIGQERSDRKSWRRERGPGSTKDLEPGIELRSLEAQLRYKCRNTAHEDIVQQHIVFNIC